MADHPPTDQEPRDPGGTPGGIEDPPQGSGLDSPSGRQQNPLVTPRPTGPPPQGPPGAPKPRGNWASRLDKANLGRDYDLNIFFKRNGPELGNTALSQKQKAVLIFKRLKAPVGALLYLDDGRRDRLVLTIRGDVPHHTLALSASHQAKPGLYTKPIAPIVKVQPVEVGWVTRQTSNDEIRKSLEHFGIIVGEITNKTFARDSEDEEASWLAGVKRPNRIVMMKVRRPIPSVIIVEGKRASVTYADAVRTCTRCLKRFFECPGNGYAKECQAIYDDYEDSRGVPKGDIEEEWKRITGMTVSMVDNTEGAGVEADYLIMEGIPEEATREGVYKFLTDSGLNIEISQVVRFEDEAGTVDPKKWRVNNLLPKETYYVMCMISGREVFGNNVIRCCPFSKSTPLKSLDENALFAPSNEVTPVSGQAAAGRG